MVYIASTTKKDKKSKEIGFIQVTSNYEFNYKIGQHEPNKLSGCESLCSASGHLIFAPKKWL